VSHTYPIGLSHTPTIGVSHTCFEATEVYQKDNKKGNEPDRLIPLLVWMELRLNRNTLYKKWRTEREAYPL